MRLNHDYVRSILLFIEQETSYKGNTQIPVFHNEIRHTVILKSKDFEDYDQQELAYALELLIKEGFIECSRQPHFNNGNLNLANIIGLTWKGHELLDNIRDNTIWTAVKQKASKIGGFSLTILASTAKDVANALMSDSNAIQNFMQGIENIFH